MLGKVRQLISKNTLLKISSYNSIGVVLKILGGLITSKIIAVYLGERGMALMGYLRNFLSTVQTTGSLGYGTGIIKYVASQKGDAFKVASVLSTAVILSALATLVVALLLFCGADFWNDQLFGSGNDYGHIFKYLAVALPFIVANGILIAIINGHSAYKKVVIINIITNLLGIAATVSLIITLHISGALLAIILAPVIGLFVTLFFLGKETSLLKNIKIQAINRDSVKKLSSYTLMSIFSMIVLPIVYIAIRNEIVAVEDLKSAGYWDGMVRISDYYFRFIATLLTLYILPQLAKANTMLAFRKEVFGFYKTILPLFCIGLIGIYLLRAFVVRLIFTEDFLPMLPIFKWQLAGDVFKVASIVIGYQIIAKNMLKLFLITEIISLIVIYLTSVFFVRAYGFEGAAIGHLVSYAVHLMMLLFIFRKSLFSKISIPID